MTIALGIDPGFRNVGVGAVQRDADGSLRTIGVRFNQTEPDKQKRHQRLRVSMDDERRVREHYEFIMQAIRDAQPSVIGVEAYHVHDSQDVEALRGASRKLLAVVKGSGGPQGLASPAGMKQLLGAVEGLEKALAIGVGGVFGVRGRGVAAKTMLVYSAALCASYAAGIPVFVFMPIDLKTKIAQKKSASKQEMANMLCAMVPGLRETVTERIRAKTKHEHVYDATGHALLALLEYERWKSDTRIN